MDQAPRGDEAPNEAQTPERISARAITAGFPDPLGPSDARTPLGEPMNRFSAYLLARIPFDWHRDYWVSLGVLGMSRGEDELIMALMIEIEQGKIPDQRIKDELSNTWDEFQRVNREHITQRWQETSADDEALIKLLRDVDRMLVDKFQKARSYLVRHERLMINSLRVGNLEEARHIFERLALIYQKLREEERRNRLPDDNDSVESMSDEDGSDEDEMDEVQSSKDASDEDQPGEHQTDQDD